jgi:hypothetical protein
MAKRTWSKAGVSQEKLHEYKENAGKSWTPNSKGYIDYKGIKSFVPKNGENCIRIIQPLEVEDIGHWAFVVHFHRGVGVNNDYYLCLKRMCSTPDPICEKQTAELWEENPDLAKTYYPDTRCLVWVHDLKSKDPKELLLWSAPKSLVEDIVGQSNKKGTRVYVDVSHPITGVPVYFDREGSGKLTKYKNIQLGDKSVVLEDDLLDKMYEFKEMLIYPTYEEIKAADEGKTPPSKSNSTSSSSEPSNMDCFGKEFDNYQDCDQCNLATDCKSICQESKNPEPNDVPEPKRVPKVKPEPEPEPEPEQEPESEVQEDPNPVMVDATENCFQKEFDKWEECDTCPRRAECEPKLEKMKKPKAMEKKIEKVKVEEKKEELMDKIRKQIASRKAKK